jgi:hypothetical protein
MLSSKELSMSLKQKYILKYGVLWAFAVFLIVAAEDHWLNHSHLSWITLTIRLLIFLLIGLVAGTIGWHRKQKKLQELS